MVRAGLCESHQGCCIPNVSKRTYLKIDREVGLVMDMKYTALHVRPIVSIREDAVCIVESRYVRYFNQSTDGKILTIDREISDTVDHYYVDEHTLN